MLLKSAQTSEARAKKFEHAIAKEFFPEAHRSFHRATQYCKRHNSVKELLQKTTGDVSSAKNT
jgi:hypothetical protein